ncbi:hypothetical protein BMF94_5932 [Rhodotorula taiwanensis]|uniref:Phosphatidic acid phosphatase type 2/haloperoxidase domain-containing protein n=1 Tax=Rhodotorula taiwanensis TaxID=741276 RepID=A0A2S5B2K2_9BASI|nr:hypothetical protein BMF94_5932 [Rhodotorula taiwanensis]
MDVFQRLVHGPDRPKRPFDRKRVTQLVYSYLPDWILTIVLLVLIGVLTDKAGYKRQFSLTDTSIQHTYAVHERISFGMCIVYSAVIPLIIMAAIALIWRRSFWDCHSAILGLLLSVSLTTVFTQVVKVCVGRPRPDLIDRCQPVQGAANAAVYGLATVAVCTVQTGHIIDDGFKSFPSGHSSFAWAGLGYFSLYLAGKMRLFDRRGHAIKAWIAIAPLIGATLIAVSRTMDYRHHATDVIAGSILGALIALVTYHLYYPSLFSANCNLPYSPRIPPTRPDDRIALDSATSESDGGAGHDFGGETAPRPNGGGAAAGGGPGRTGHILPFHRNETDYSAANGRESHDLPQFGNGGGGVNGGWSEAGAGRTAARPAGGDMRLDTKSGYDVGARQ